MRPKEDVQWIFSLVKSQIKNRNYTYAQMARKLNMSESNLKRIFSAKSCSLEQMLCICEAADVSFFDFVATGAKSRVRTYSLSEKAESYFVKNFDAFIFYRNLSGSSDTAKFLDSLKIPKPIVTGYLKNLEMLGLIKTKGKKIEPVDSGYLDTSKSPALARKITAKWVPWFFSKIEQNKAGSDKYSLRLSSTGLTKQNAEQLKNEIAQLLEKYREIGVRDQTLHYPETEPIGICIGIGPHRIGFFENAMEPDPILPRF